MDQHLTLPAPPTISRTRQHQPRPQRHRWVDQGLAARGEPLRKLVQWVTQAVGKIEQHEGARQRARRPADQVNHLARLDALVCNLAYAVLEPPPTGRLALRMGSPRGGMTRYENRAFGPKPLRQLINQLDAADFLSRKYSTLRGEVSSIAPSAWFAEKVREHGVSLSDFGRDPNEEVILLSRNMRSTTPTGERVTERDFLDYEETAETRRCREEMRRLNAFLAAADIGFVDDELEPRVNPFDRALRRRFVIRPGQPERFDQSGRLFGGFWLQLKSARRQGIRINGEPVADLDFGSMFTRLAYGRLGAKPPRGDLYAVAGAEGYRSGIKLAMNTFLFDTHMRRSKWPKEMGVGVGTDVDALDPSSPAAAFDHRLPAGWTVGRTRKAILKRHPKLGAAWGRGLGHELMFDESRVLLLALDRLMDKGVPALPMHDGLLVQRSKKRVARAVMAKAAREIAGISIPVEEKA
jgi:hypothetical protein